MSFPRAWLTPDTLPAATVCRRLRYPDSEEWGAIVRGCLLLLAEPENWEKFGAITPEQAAERSWDMWQAFTADTGVCLLGAIVAYASAAPPPDTLDCDGATHLRVDFPELYAVLDSAFIIDPDSFFVPDLRDRVVAGIGSSYVMNAAGGVNSVALSIAEMPVHAHADLGHSHVEGIALPSAAPVLVGVPIPSAIPGVGVTGLGSANITNTGGGVAHENRQPFRALGWAIVAR